MSRRRVQLIVILSVVASFVAAATPLPISLLVGRFTASHLYRDDRLVYGSGQVQLGTYEYDRWAEAPADMVQDALIRVLRNSGQYAAVSRVAASVRGNYIIRGHLLQMYGVDQPALVSGLPKSCRLFPVSSGPCAESVLMPAGIWTRPIMK